MRHCTLLKLENAFCIDLKCIGFASSLKDTFSLQSEVFTDIEGLPGTAIYACGEYEGDWVRHSQ